MYYVAKSEKLIKFTNLFKKTIKLTISVDAAIQRKKINNILKRTDIGMCTSMYTIFTIFTIVKR